MTTEYPYKGWVLKVYKHIHHPAYPDWNVSAWKKQGDKWVMFNVEAHTPEEALEKARAKIREK
jgi:hypothetical protein